MKRQMLKYKLLLLLPFVFAGVAKAQDDPCKKAIDFNEWWYCRVEQIANARISQRDVVKQSETPSTALNSTALVDKSSASDLVGVALNLAGLSSESSEEKATSMSATVSAYALKAAASSRDPLDPSFYNANRDWRRVWFTLGFEYLDNQVGMANERATIYGLKFLPYNKRDASDPSNQLRVKKISDKASAAAASLARNAQRIQ